MAFLYDVSKLFRRVAFGYSYVYDSSLNGGWGGHKWATTTTPYKTTIVTYENGSEQYDMLQQTAPLSSSKS